MNSFPKSRHGRLGLREGGVKLAGKRRVLATELREVFVVRDAHQNWRSRS